MSSYDLPPVAEIRPNSPTIEEPTNAVDENDPVYILAMGKLYDAAWKFDRETNGDLLKVNMDSFHFLTLRLASFFIYLFTLT